MTRAEVIRQMTDEELAAMLDETLSQRDRWWVEKLRQCDVDVKLTVVPAVNRLHMLELLQMEEGT